MNTAQTLQLYDFQQEAQQNVVNEFLSPTGAWRQLGVWPTGTGKTICFSTLSLHKDFAGFLQSFPPNERKILVIAHRTELITQAKEKFERYNPTLNVQIEQADQAADDQADVIVASIQTLASRSGRRLARIDKKQIRLVICDEAHHASASTYLSVFQYFGFLPPDTFMPKTRPMAANEALAYQRARLEAWDATGKPARLLLGVTATPNRTDRVGLEAVFQKITFEEKLRDMIKRGYLCRLKALRIHSPINIDSVHTKGGDFDEAELFEAINTVERNRVIVKAWLDHAEGLKTVVFCGNVKYAQALAAEFCANGRKFAAIHANSTDRKELLAGLASGELEGLCNVAVLTEGWDLPTLQCVLLARPTKSAALLTQMVGRGTRLSPGKLHCLIIDIVDVTSKHSLMTTPTLFGLPIDYDAGGKDLSEEVEAIEQMKIDHPMLDTASARSLDELQSRATEVDLFGPFKADEIVDHSTLAWMKVGEEYQISYIGPNSFQETMKIKPNNFGGFDILTNEFDQDHMVKPPVHDIESAFQSAESFIRENRKLQANTLKRDAGWRTKPATAAQGGLVDKLGAYLKVPAIDKGTLKMGQASDLIALYRQKVADQQKGIV